MHHVLTEALLILRHGTLDVLNPAHSDFPSLREALLLPAVIKVGATSFPLVVGFVGGRRRRAD